MVQHLQFVPAFVNDIIRRPVGQAAAGSSGGEGDRKWSVLEARIYIGHSISVRPFGERTQMEQIVFLFFNSIIPVAFFSGEARRPRKEAASFA